MNSKLYYILLLVVLFLIYFGCTSIMHKKLNKIEQKLEQKEIRYHNLIDSLYNKYDKTLKEYEDMLDSLPLGPPLDTLIVQDDYGVRKHPISRKWRMHSGIDLVDSWRDTVYSTGDGTVKFAGWNSGYGRCVVISHIGGYESKYAHLSRLFVKKGESIVDNQPIGRCGSSGYATGQHLHYEILRNGKTTDPLPYITQTY